MAINIAFSISGYKVVGLKQADNITYDVTFTVDSYPEVIENNMVAFDTMINGSVSAGDMQRGQVNILTNPSGDAVSYGMLNDNGITSIDAVTGEITNLDPVENSYTNTDYDLELIASKTANFRVSGKIEKNGLSHSSDYVGPVTGSLLDYVESEMLAMISGETFGDEGVSVMFTVNSSDVSNPDVVFNANNISAAYEDGWSGASILLSTENDVRYPLHLVTPMHAVCTYHLIRDTNLGIGTEVVFKRIDGTYQKVSIVDFVALERKFTTNQLDANGVWIGADLAIILFDADVTGCELFQVMPSGWLEKYSPLHTMTRQKYAATGALVYLFRAMHNLAGQWIEGGWTQIYSLGLVDTEEDYGFSGTHLTSRKPIFTSWGRSSIAGDSGGTLCMPVNSRLVLLGCLSGTSIDASMLSYFINEINTEMNNLSGVQQGTYTLEHPDLSMFNVYN